MGAYFEFSAEPGNYTRCAEKSETLTRNSNRENWATVSMVVLASPNSGHVSLSTVADHTGRRRLPLGRRSLDSLESASSGRRSLATAAGRGGRAGHSAGNRAAGCGRSSTRLPPPPPPPPLDDSPL